MRRARCGLVVLGLAVAAAHAAAAAMGDLVNFKPDAFTTLVNPNCSHCRDEAKRRAGELKADEPVLCWIRGYSDGGAIPHRFFLSPFRVISDTYGVFVYDPDAGYARGFAPSLDFAFHGWRNGVMVMRHKDGTLYSCLSGRAFAGPRTGDRLQPVPTLTSTWGDWMKKYPHAVAYHMFDKYRPVELPKQVNADSMRTRLPAKSGFPVDEVVLGIADHKTAVAIPVASLKRAGVFYFTRANDEGAVAVWQNSTKTAAAYGTTATPPKSDQGAPRKLRLRRIANRDGEFTDDETASTWDIAGRATAGPLKGWTLEWLDAVQVKWFAWTAEHPGTAIFKLAEQADETRKTVDKQAREIAGAAEFLRTLPKHFGELLAIDPAAHTATLKLDGETLAKVWPLAADAEVKRWGWWARTAQFTAGDRVWVWFHLNRAKQPASIAMLSDEVSEQDIHTRPFELVDVSPVFVSVKAAGGVARRIACDALSAYRGREPVSMAGFHAGEKVLLQTRRAGSQIVDEAGFEARRRDQRQWLRERWQSEGLPGTVSVLHPFSGEFDFLVDHEGMRWARSLRPGNVVRISAEPPVQAVVRQVEAWRDRTLVRLVASGSEQADLAVGQRRRLMMTAPPTALDAADFPSDVDLSRPTGQRVEWLLASIYCVCPVSGDTCTGHFYTLASCNPNGCGMPNHTRQEVARWIDAGWSDRQILAYMVDRAGPKLLRQHLAP